VLRLLALGSDRHQNHGVDASSETEIAKNKEDDDDRAHEPNDAIHPEALQLYI
jgi:hypothetical protein